MPKFILFVIALLWTSIVLYLCLVQSNDLPVINFPNLDKCIHTFFHFVFTFVWFLFFYKQLKLDSIFKPLLISFVMSVVFGIGIEILQGLVTATRSADVMDGVANLVGAVLAVLLAIVCNKYNILKIIVKQ